MPAPTPDSAPPAVTADQARQRCDPAALGFATTAEAEPVQGLVGQERALAALRFGTRMTGDGFNLYVLGSPGSGRHRVVTDFLATEAAGAPVPPDWCYVHSFDDPQKPKGIALPAGRGRGLKEDMHRLVEDLRASIPAAFEGESYRNQLAEIEQEFNDRNRQALEKIQAEAETEGLGLLPTPRGFAIAPVRKGRVLAEEEFNQLPEAERNRMEAAIERLSGRLREHIENLPVWHKERRERIRELDRNVTMLAVGSLIRDLVERYQEFPAVTTYLDAVRQDVLDNAHEFRPGDGDSDGDALPPGFGPGRRALFRRYAVNVLVDHSQTRGAPVVYESNPTHANLVGRIEHASQFGALVTDFTLVRPGALHGASGGYLVLDVEKVLLQPFAWEALKRSLRSRSIAIESLAQLAGLMAAQGVEPDPMPLQLKVVLIGNRLLYYLLCELDPEFSQLFKVAADFEDTVPRSATNVALFGRLLAGIIQQRNLRPFTAPAIARVIEESARTAGDATRLSAAIQGTADLLSEADYWARQRADGPADVADVETAIAQRITRQDRVRQQLQEAIQRDIIHVRTEGAVVGQVNGLSVLQLGEFAFGQPARITATVRVGDGHVVDIEREVELGGAVHSKGVLILSAYLGATYARDWPLSLGASLVFEQNYGGVEGDSASLAELVALLSAIAGVPLRQDLAVTGSVDQLGRSQAIGGVNEKVEGFFDVCAARGLTGTQGVLIPRDNVQHLMLRGDVVAAIAAGTFRVWPVGGVGEVIGLLTGLPPGERDGAGNFPPGSFNARVEEALRQLARRREAFGATRRERRQQRRRMDHD